MKKTSRAPLASIRSASFTGSRGRADGATIEGLEARRLFDGGPTIGSYQLSHESIVPGNQLEIVLDDVMPGDGGVVEGVSIYRDVNADGALDSGDELFGQAVQDFNDPARWTFARLIEDNIAVGDVTLFAVPHGPGDEDGGPVAFGVDFQYRIFYPEGWRNDSTINEYVPMVNPNGFDVQYRVVARYETGERDEVIAEGTIPARSRGGITVSEYANPGNAVVRLNAGYALEIQSTAYIGATLSHYDSFTGQQSTGAAVGESFTNETSREWFFADVSNVNADFILFYNPFDVQLNLNVTFYDEAGAATTVPWSVGGLRRSGIALSNPALGLAPGNHFGVFITSTDNQQFVASISSYSTTSEIGYSSLGQRLGVTVFPLVEFRESTDNQLVLFNPAGAEIDVTVRFMYIDSAQAPAEVTYAVPARQRLSVDLDNLRPNDASAVTLRVTGGYVQVLSVDETRGDSLQASAASTAYSVWTFGDGFLDSNTAGTVGFESLGIYNPRVTEQQVQVRFFFTDGTVGDRFVTIAPRSGARLQLDQEPLILQHGQLNFYSIAVYAQSQVVASMVHWDLFQGGGWTSIGTPGGNPGGA
jgi:hypothetical protein